MHADSFAVVTPIGFASPVVTTPAPPVIGLERAQLVWRWAQDRFHSTGPGDLLVEALGVSRAAHHDPATMAHALGLGRAKVRRDGDDPIARGGVHLLERAIAFLDRAPGGAPGEVDHVDR